MYYCSLQSLLKYLRVFCLCEWLYARLTFWFRHHRTSDRSDRTLCLLQHLTVTIPKLHILVIGNLSYGCSIETVIDWLLYMPVNCAFFPFFTLCCLFFIFVTLSCVCQLSLKNKMNECMNESARYTHRWTTLFDPFGPSVWCLDSMFRFYTFSVHFIRCMLWVFVCVWQ